MAKKVEPKKRTISVRDHDTEARPRALAPIAPSSERRAQVDAADLAARAADRLHHPDLTALLADQRPHRVRDQHERREQRQHREHVHQRGELRRTAPCPGSPRARGCSGRSAKRVNDVLCAQVLAYLVGRAVRGRRRRVGEPEGEQAVARLAAERAPPSRASRRGRRSRRSRPVWLHSRFRPTPLTRSECVRSPTPTTRMRVTGNARRSARRSRSGASVSTVARARRSPGRDRDDDRPAGARSSGRRRRTPSARRSPTQTRGLDDARAPARPRRSAAGRSAASCAAVTTSGFVWHREVGEPVRPHLALHRAVHQRRDREDADARDRDRERRARRTPLAPCGASGR